MGISSYLLVIYYNNSKACNSGIVTLISNRVGDAIILVRIGLIIESMDYDIYSYTYDSHKVVFILLMVASCTKRAQIPFRAWLPAAMAAPTPVSSLVHSSTLVTAGVYLIFRHGLWLGADASLLLLVLGLLRNLISRLGALFETDLKKMVALSTLSQLGVMIVALGVGRRFLAFFHLVVHAIFKALLFICTGVAIHFSQDYQDMRVMGAMRVASPVLSGVILICNFRLIGFPFIASFFSKELVLEYIILFNHGLLLYVLFVFRIGLTLIYSLRFLVIFSLRSYDFLSLRLKSGLDFNYVVRIRILLFPAITVGYFFRL